ncbi:type II toxin-antitoxin system Phd/YefM family antitoxin [Thalassotalea sp. PS06]|uniref:type II toxin-antitoxin system Phd/YefM family antitoxin n=1 Tax=Thalassotalea sp. PS06 TaxID=2594005 RepID=UPI00163DB294|nr:type II toxin-antitoxin system Phd/YefM family antitoxin [Thalassotalea sp. PS06]
MAIQTVTSREFNQDPTAAKRAALSSPVQITERGKVSHVLISIEQYEEMTKTAESIVDLLSMPKGQDIDFEVPKLDASSVKAADLD